MLLTRSNPWSMMNKGPKTVDASVAVTMIKKDEVKSGSIMGDQFNFEDKKNAKYEATIAPAGDQRDFIKLLDEHNVTYKFDKSPFSSPIVGTLISIVLPLGFLVVLWMLFMRQAQAGNNQAMSFGRSRAKRLNENVPKVTFEDVAGVDEAKQELEEVVEFLQERQEVRRARSEDSQGRAASGTSRLRQDAARARNRGRGRSAVLPHQRIGLRRDVRGRGRVAR